MLRPGQKDCKSIGRECNRDYIGLYRGITENQTEKIILGFSRDDTKECKGLNDCQHNFEVYLRYPMPQVYKAPSTVILVITSAPTPRNEPQIEFQYGLSRHVFFVKGRGVKRVQYSNTP